MLASQGMRTTVRHVHNLLPNKAGVGTSTTRGLHIPSLVRIHPRLPNLGQTQNLFTKSRHFITRFFNLLTAPGFRVPVPTTVEHAVHGATRYPTIQQGFSFHVRNRLSGATQTRFFPRAPRPPPRSVVQVGLGTARNFSSSRPLFHNLVENVPVAGRAIYNADLDMKLRKEKDAMRKPVKGSSKKQRSKEMLEPKARDFSTTENKVSKHAEKEAEMNKYFAAPVVPDVTTCLLIPLAPTPTARVPLRENTGGSLLPLPALAALHHNHELHSIRVSSLFSRLDAADVWTRGVQCSAFSHGGGPEGVCTMLKVEFVGWSKAQVRSVLGESGTGWCVLEETKTSEVNGISDLNDSDFDDTLSEASSVFSGVFEGSISSSRSELVMAEANDPSQSLILPSLDFSSAFSERSSSAPQVNNFLQSNTDFDPWLDSEEPSDIGSRLPRSGSWIDPGFSAGWNGFSSNFAGRVDAAKL